MGISLKPSTAITGGLVQDIDVTVTNARFVVFDYEGKGKPCLAARITMEPVEPGDEIVQHYSAGSLERFAPSADNSTPLTEVGEEGCYIVVAEGSTATALSASTNFAFFNKELVIAGFPEDRIEDDISCLEGTVMHIVRKPAPKRDGLNSEAPVAGAREKTVLVPNKCLKFPWDGKKPATVKAKAAAASAGTKTTSDANSLTVDVIRGLLEKNPNGITPNDAKKSAFPTLLKNTKLGKDDRNLILAQLTSAEWLADNQGPETGFGFDGDTILSV